MATQSVSKIVRNYPPIIWPEDHIVVGYKPDTRGINCPILEGELSTVEVPEHLRPADWKTPQVDAAGNPVYRKNNKGENMGRVHKIRNRTMRIRYWLVPRGSGKLTRFFDFQEDPTELEARERRGKVARFQADLAEAAVARGLSPDQMLDAMLVQAQGGAADEEEDENAPYPRALGGGHWELSDGSKIRGKKMVAEAAEAALLPTGDGELAAAGAAVPEGY